MLKINSTEFLENILFVLILIINIILVLFYSDEKLSKISNKSIN